MKNRIKLFAKVFFVCVVCLMVSGSVSANNLNIYTGTVSIIAATNPSVSDGDTVKFDISWDNSWRNTGTPNSTMNYDGVWIFVKYRDACDRNSPYPGMFQHMRLAGSSQADTSKHKIINNNSFGLTKQLGFNGSSAVGIYVYRASNGYGSVAQSTIKLVWDKTQAGIGGNWDLRVNAIEMVYIPQGSFRLGGGDVTVNGSITYTFGTNSTGLVPYQVTTENSTIALNSSSGIYTYNQSATGTIPATYPKGYDAFWCMKYEVSQQQYVDMINALDRTEQLRSVYYGPNGGNTYGTYTATSIPTNYPWCMYQSTGNSSVNSANSRNYIRIPVGSVNANVPLNFGVDGNPDGNFSQTNDGQFVAMNYLYYGQSMRFLKRYLDWACLRPMSEMEFEKVCRGPIANVSFMNLEPIWGHLGTTRNDLTSSTIGSTVTITNALLATEAINSYDPCASLLKGSVVWGNSTGGPVRVGITHKTCGSPETRIQAGSSYYGVADMCGNLWEYVYSVGLNPSNTGVSAMSLSRLENGDGDITTGYTNFGYPTNWDGGDMWRGGSWNNTTDWQWAYLSMRYWTNCSEVNTGGRGVRTAN